MVEAVRRLLLQWYDENKRDLPWRQTSDPYHIWLSEIILQQTRVAQGLPYYQRFVKNYPTVHHLAEADEAQVLKDWEGLGYYSRARNLHFTAQQLSREQEGNFPEDYKGLLKLKGVGDYTAAAIASIAYNEAQPVLDGNVFRVLSRLFNEKTAINTTEGKKKFRELAGELLDPEEPSCYNQAIMEFGALHCVPSNPACGSCPLNNYCQAYQKGSVEELPVKFRKKYDVHRYFNYLLLQKGEEVAVQKRKQGIWQGLYQFLLIETKAFKSTEDVLESEDFKALVQENFTVGGVYDLPVHKLSHQSLHLRVLKIKLTEMPRLSEQYEWISTSALAQLAFPRPLRQFLDQKQLYLPFG